MNQTGLTTDQLTALKCAHSVATDKRHADRLKAVYLWGKGWTAVAVAEALLMDRETVARHVARYQAKGLAGLERLEAGGSEARLSAAQLHALDAQLQETLHPTADAVIQTVQDRFGVRYSRRGITHLLHRLDFVYKAPVLIPGKADEVAQEAFVEDYKELKTHKAPTDPVYFMDATHPQHNTVAGCGWIKRGKTFALPSNTGRKRLNINGAISLDTLEPVIRFDDVITAQSAIALMQAIEQKHPLAELIYIICDNARYYLCHLVKEYLRNSRIILISLPPYSPNLNLIERYWLFFRKQVLYGKYYERFDDFKHACDTFFAQSADHVTALRSLLTENFQILSGPAFAAK